MCYLTLVAGAPLPLALTALHLVLVLGRLQESTVQVGQTVLDRYNVNTLKHIRDNHPGAFHLMMADIYAQAK